MLTREFYEIALTLALAGTTMTTSPRGIAATPRCLGYSMKGIEPTLGPTMGVPGG